MSFWITQDYFVTIDTTIPLQEYYGNHRGFDTYEEALTFMEEFNADPKRLEDKDVCGSPCRTYPLSHY